MKTMFSAWFSVAKSSSKGLSRDENMQLFLSKPLSVIMAEVEYPILDKNFTAIFCKLYLSCSTYSHIKAKMVII